MVALKFAGSMTAIASFLHVLIIFGGADWYRFFGAGEGMARLSEQGELYPTIVTSGIVFVLAIWSIYAFSGAGIITRLPFTKTVLSLVSLVFLARGFLAIPLVLNSDSLYMQELAEKMTFMVTTSLVCIILGAAYAVGTCRLIKAGRLAK
ncbi:hypothetical protein [Shewanella atlantica]|uniref:hypothetical protein n=1 Tax=Shewanella atlantica TaxID=271099 RepID=UPI003734E5D5